MDVVAAVCALPVAWALVAVGYLAGSVPFGLVLARAVAGKDVRTAGSGNIGATNVARVVGRKLGIATLVLDALKGVAPVAMVAQVPLPELGAAHRLFLEGAVALAAVVGHCFPVWLRCRGGKGVATGLGVLLACRPDAAVAGLIAFVVVFALARRVSAGSIAGALAGACALVLRGPLDVTLVPIGLCALVIIARHHANIRRLVAGRELKV